MRGRISKELVKTLRPADKPYEVVDTTIKGFLLRVQPSGSMTYYFAYRANDGRKTRYRIEGHGTLTAPQARDVAKDLAKRVAAGEDIQAIKKQARVAANLAKTRTLRGFLDSKYGPWATNHLKEGKSATVRIERQFDFLLNTALTDITAWQIEKWRSERIRAGISKSTVNRDLAALKACLNKAVEWGVIDQHKVTKVKLLRTNNVHRIRFLSEDEEIRLRDALNRRDVQLRKRRRNHIEWQRIRGYQTQAQIRSEQFPDYLHPMVLLSLNTGMRRGEITHLEWDDVNLSRSDLLVRGSNAKSGHSRYIPLTDEAKMVLKRWQSNSSVKNGLVFPGTNGQVIKSIKTAWGRLIKSANIQNFRFHDLRHHFASKLVMSGVDLNTVRELLGHQSLEMTLRYAHLSKDHKHAAIEKLNKNIVAASR